MNPDNVVRFKNHFFVLYLIYFIALTFCTFSMAQNFENQDQPKSILAQQLFEMTRPSVFQIKTALNAKAPKTSYGSGFVVSKEGLIITNYHVVSSAIQENKDYRLFMVDGEDSIPAQILAIDIIHDIALLKVERTFENFLELAVQMPSQGSKIYSIGIPMDLNMSITEGNYNGILQDGPYSHIHMASPLNSGMSGGPTVNKKGQVVGVNVSVVFFSQNISFSVPVEHVKDLLKEKDLHPLKKRELHKIISNQIDIIQKKLSNDLNQNNLKESFKLDTWEVVKPPKSLKCWSSNQDDEDGYYGNIFESCNLNSAAFLDDEISTGSYEYSYNAFSSRKLNYLQLLSLVSNNINRGSSFENILFSTFKSPSKVLTPFHCKEEKILNKHQISFLIKYCLRGYVMYPDFYNIEVRAVTLNKQRKILVFTAALTGFSLDNIKKFINTHLEGIHESSRY